MEQQAPPGQGSLAKVGLPDMDEGTCLATADGLFRKGEYESALQWYSRALRFAIELEQAWFGQVQCLLSLEEYVEANIWAERAIERFPNSADLLAAKAMALSRTRGADRAMAYSDASLTVKGQPVGPYPWVVRGDLMLNGGSRQSAERCFGKAIELGGQDWYTHFLVGLSFLRRGSEAEALSRFSKAAAMGPRSTLVLCSMGQCYESTGAIAAARAAYRRAVHADPQCKLARQRLAEIKRFGVLRRLWRRLFGG